MDWIRQRTKIEYIFFITFCLFGLAVVFITPAGQNTDEPSHVYRVWQLANFNLKSDIQVKNNITSIGGDMPTNLVNLFLDSGGPQSLNPTFKFNSIDRASLLKLKNTPNKTFVAFAGAAQYSPVAYLPYFPATFAGIIFHLPFLITLYLMRISSLIFVVILIFLAIRFIPFGKWAIFTIALLPSTLTQAASVTADSMAIATGLLAIALTLKFVFDKSKPSILNTVLITSLFVVLALTKVNYTPLAFLPLLAIVYNQHYKSLRGVLAASIPPLFSIVCALVWMHMTSYANTVGYILANPSVQEHFILHNPFQYLKVLFYTLFTNQAQTEIYTSFFGNFSWLTAPLAPLFMIVATINLTLSSFLTTPRERNYLALVQRPYVFRLTAFLLFGVSVVGIATALYLYSSPVRYPTVTGIQGRYFLPIIPLVLVALYGNAVKNQQVIKYTLISLVLVTLMSTVFTLYFRYYHAPFPLM